MTIAATLTLSSTIYEPFGAGVSFQVFEPQVTIPSGVQYVGASRYGAVANDVPAFNETLSITHNLTNAGRTKDSIKGTIKVPIVRSVGGVDTVVDVAYVTVEYRVPTTCTESERERLYYLMRTAHNNTPVQTAVTENSPPR